MGKKRTNNYEDITEYGTSGLGGIRANSTGDSEIDPVVKSLNEEAARSYHNRGYVNKVSDEGPVKYIGLELEQAGYGKSSYDKGIPYSQLSNIEDWRGQEQPWYAQLGAGVLKGIGLAGTTFLDGTVGLIYGIGQAIAERDASMLFNNDFSVALRQFNQMMEEELPNYRTKDEIENPWALRNIFSMNTFADDFLKNLGFTVGAFYSGNAYLGALKGIGLAGKMSTSAAKLIGSTLSGFSEARIEAGNLYDEQVKAEQQNIDAAKEQIKTEVLSAPEYTQAFDNLKQEYEARLAQINAQPDNMVTGPDGRLTNPKTALQNQLFNEYQSKIKALENSAMSEINIRVQRLEQDVHERAKNAAIADMVLNAIYLPFTDAYAYGKLYGRKFNFKSELADKVDDAAKVGRKQATKAIDKAAEAEAIEETLGKRVVKQGKEYVANPVKAKQAAAKGFKIGLSEGSEEMNQAFFSSFSSNLYQPDSPDAYYNALKNDDYDIQTKDAMTALTEGFMDSWGNAQTYKEGLVGFLTGMIGMPTFGRVNNSDSNTYLGKGKMIGLSGGIFGEIQNANRLNREAAEAVQVMNKIQDRVDDAKSFFIRAKSFRDATDGYSKESNKFEFNSAADNELFHAIDAFARTGRLQDLKDIISEDIDNASQEQLEDIARNFSSNENQYKEVDGSDMASTEDGQKEMKDIINQRKKEIFDGIDSYQKALEKARRIGNNSLTSDQVAELAWLQWKVDKFSDRFNSIKDKDMEKLTELQNAIHTFKNGRGRGMIDEESEEGKNILQAIDTVDLFIDLLRASKNPIQFGTLVKNSGNTRDWLRFFGYPIFEGMVGYNAEEFDDLINDLDDTVKIAEASESFNERYKEFKADPTKLIKNREKIDKKKQSEKDVKDKADLKTSLDNMSVSEIAEKLRNKEISDDQIASIEDKERKAPIEPDIDLTAAQKLEQAMQINDAAERAIDALQQQMEQSEGGIEAFEDAVKQIEENMSKAESLDDFFDLSSAAFVDSQILAPEEPADLTPEQKEALDSELDDRRDAATAINKGILEKVKKDKETADNLPKPPTPGTEPEEVSTGHDGTTQAKTVAETNKAKKETERKEAEQPKIDYTAEAIELLRQFGIVAPDKPHQVIPLTIILDSFNKFTALDNNILACIERCRNIMAYSILARSIDPRYEKGNILPLIDNMLLAYAGKPKDVTKPTEEKTTDEEDVVTPTISRTQIEGQERQESKRSYDSSPKTGPLNYWKPATTEYPIHDDNRENITYAQRLLNIATDEVIKLLPQVKSSDKSQLRNAIEDLVKSLLTEPLSQVQNSEAYKIAELLVGSEKLDKVLQMFTDGKIAKVDLQRTRRTVAVTDYLRDRKAYEKIDNGQVTKGTKVPKVRFKVDKKLNEDAGETVILITDTEGNPLGDIMSKNEQIASRQVGLLPFIEKCEKYLESHKDEEIVELPYESTISQLMVGKAPYTNESNRPTLNTIFEGQPFKIGVAMTAGANATIKMTSSPKSEKLTDEEASIWEPLNAIKGQPYLLLPTGNAKKKYICVPFLMPVYNSGVADTALGRAIKDVLSQIMDAETKANAVKVKNKLLELLSLKDIWINYDNGNVHFTVTRHGENSQRTLYKGPLNNNAIDAILNKLQGTSFRVNRKYINSDYEGQDYNSMIGELATCNIKKGTTHTINNWFTINPIGVSSTGEASESKAERVKPIGTNPNAKPKSSANTSGMLTVFGNSLVDPDTFEVYEMDGKTPFKGQPNAIIVRKARAFGMKENKDMTQPYDTDWGRYDPVKNKIIAPKEEKPVPAEPKKSEDEQNLIDWLCNASNVEVIKDVCRTCNTVEDAVNKIITEHFANQSEDVKLFVRNILRFDSARKIVQSYIDETHPKKSSLEVTNFNSAFRVQNSKLLHKEDIIDVMSYSDVDLLLNIRHPGFPDSLMIVLDWDRGRFNVQFQFLPGVKYVQNTPEADEYDRILSKQEVQEIIDNYIPKDLQEFFTSGEYRKRESESQARADQLYPDSLDDRIKYLITDPENSHGVLKNKWGIFWENPSTRDNNFPTENPEAPQAEQPVVSDEEVPQGNILESGDTLNADAKAKGYLRTERRKNVWEALNLAQKNALLAMSKLKGEQTMKTLESPSYFDNNKREFKKDITSLLGGFKLREAKSNSKVWNQQQERRWLAKVLPNLNQTERLRIVDAVIKVGNEKNPITAWGMFQNGIITIWNRAARGTLYHEAFHAVTDLLLTDEERRAMFDSARQAYGNLEPIALEERLAEDFRKYVQIEEKPVVGRLIRLFRTLKHILQNLLGKEPYLNALFYKINRGEFANREPKVIKSTIKLSKNTAEEEEILRNAPRYRLNDSKEETLRREMQRFLGNFGITLEEVDENYNGDLFDDLNRIIYYNSIEDITDGVGKAVAFMMQKQKVMTDLISLYNNFGNNTKGLKRGLKSVAKAVQKAQTEEEKRKADFRLPGQKKDENISDALEAIGKDISKELRKLYGFGEEKPSFLNKVWDVIVEFFRMLTPQTRMMFDIIKHQSQHIANSIKINDKSLVVKGMVKPKTDSKATRVDVAQALMENPYEERIIAHLSTKGIALAGSASIALNGTLYRPKENPLHDIDFQASRYNKESLDKVVEELSPYWMHTNTIAKEGEGSTETYMILDRPFVSEPYRMPKKNKEDEIKGYTKVAIIKDKNTGEILGYRINSDLILKDGVKGKMLDFFTGTEGNPYGYHSMNLNGKNYLISDPRNALAAKIEWLRLKDLWDYNRYVPDDRIVNTSEQSDREVAERVKNAKIIWGHPAIGKTTYIEKHKDEILEWDEEVNPKRNRFIDSQVDPDGTLSDVEKRQKKRDYMHNWKDHPEYIAFLTREWENLKARAERENKQIFASPTPLLNLFMDDFDLFLNLTEHEFMERNQAREAGGYYSSLGWKQAINDALVRVNPDKLVTTDKYFNQIMGDDSMTPSESSDKTPTSNAELIHTTLGKIRSFYNSELSYGNLSDEQLEYLKQRKITKEQYNSMTMLEKEVLFKCMFDGD